VCIDTPRCKSAHGMSIGCLAGRVRWYNTDHPPCKVHPVYVWRIPQDCAYTDKTPCATSPAFAWRITHQFVDGHLLPPIQNIVESGQKFKNCSAAAGTSPIRISVPFTEGGGCLYVAVVRVAGLHSSLGRGGGERATLHTYALHTLSPLRVG
jgi:hypothetical protein